MRSLGISNTANDLAPRGMSRAGAERNPRKGVSAGCWMNPLPGWLYVFLCKIQFFPSASASQRQPPPAAHAKTQPTFSFSAPRAMMPVLPRLLALSWLPALCWCLQDHLCSGDAERPIVTVNLRGRQRDSHSQEQQRRGLHGASGAAGLSCNALHAGVVCSAPALGLIFCLRCTQAVLTLCFQSFH